jgi:signal transduction histidine kinase
MPRSYFQYHQILLFLAVLLCLSSNSFSEVANASINDVYVLLESENTVDLEGIQDDIRLMRPAGKQLSWSLDSGGIWLRFNVTNFEATPTKVWLETGNNYPKESLILFKNRSLNNTNDSWKVVQRLASSFNKSNLNESQTVGAWLVLPANESIDVLISFSTNRASTLNLQLLTESEFYDTAFTQRIKLSVTMGVLISLSLMSILFFIRTRKKHFIYYGGLELATVGYLFSETGFGLISFWPNMNVISEHAIYLFGASAFICFKWFGFYFLDVARRMPKLRPVYYVSSILILISMVVSLDSSWLSFLLNFFIPSFIFIFLLIHLYISLSEIYQGRTYIWPYLIGVLAEWVSGIVFFMASYGLINLNLGSEYDVVYSAIIIEGVAFLIAMTGYMQSLRARKNVIKQQLADVYQERTQELSSMVAITQDRATAINKQIEKSLELAGVSHDIHHNLFDIKLQLSFLKKNEENLVSVNQINESLTYLQDLTETLVKDNKQEVQSIAQGFSLSELFELILNEFNVLTDLKVKSVNYVEYSLPGSKVVFKRMLENLVRNALQNTTVGGVLLAARVRSGKVVLQVFDTGKGMNKDRVEQIATLNAVESPDGFGIGFSVVKTLCEQEGYELNIRSRLNRGTVVSIEIPLK